MASRRKAQVLGVVLAAIAPAIFAGPAQADDEATCQLRGQLGLTSPGAPSLLNDIENNNLGTLADTDRGDHALSAVATCARIDSDPGEEANSGRYEVELRLEGPYSSAICGSWMAFFDPVLDFGSTLSSTVSAPGWEGPIEVTYWIALRGGGAGELRFTGGTWDGKPVRGSGALTMIPADGDRTPATNPCVDEDLTLLDVTGAFQIDAVAPPSL